MLIIAFLTLFLLTDILHCFQNQPPLPNLTKEEVEFVERLMEYRQKEKQIWKLSNQYKPTDKAYFAYNLYQQPYNQNFLAAEYYKYNRLYGIEKYKRELPMCVVAVGRNMNKNHMIERFVDSVARQNYSNYFLFYSDDASTDDSVEAFKSHVGTLKMPMKTRFKAIEHDKQQYALKNRHQAIKQYCSEYSIVLDVDIDDALIGNQVFKVVNALYQSSNIWFLYSTHIKFDYDKKQPILGICDPIPPHELQKNTYRVSESWVTSELRTFQRQLYMKIDEKDYLNQHGQFYQWASDRFLLYPMIEMASKSHIYYLPQPLYFYDLSGLSYRDYTFIIPDKMRAKMLPPYLPLETLTQEAKRKENYIVPKNVREEYERSVERAKRKLKKQN